MSDINSIVQQSAKAKTGIIWPGNDNQKTVLKLMSQVSLVSSNVDGTMASKVYMRNKIISMIISLGLPSFFLTFNPTDSYNPIIKILNGEDIDIDRMTKEQVPTYWEQACKVAKNPFLAAKFFDTYMNTIVENLLGKGMNNNKGVFGTYKAHYGTVEAQGQGTLHCHMLLWVEGSLNPQEIKDKVLMDKDKQFLARLLNYIDDTIHTSVPQANKNFSSVNVLSDTAYPTAVRGPLKEDPHY